MSGGFVAETAGVSSQPVWKTYHVVTLVVAVFTCIILASLLGLGASRFVLGYEPGGEREKTVTQIFGTFLGMQMAGLFCFHLFLKWHGVGWRDGFGIRRPVFAALAGWIACLAFLPLAWGLQKLIQWALLSLSVEPKLQSTVVAIQDQATPAWQQFALTGLALIFAPIIEELMFRGVFYRWMRDRGRPRLALWGSALLFGLIHFNVVAFIPLTLFGALLAWLYQRTGNLLVPIFTHCFFNLFNVLAIFYWEPVMKWLSGNP
jgi:membrane protease YdiL (CAAX protease family)